MRFFEKLVVAYFFGATLYIHTHSSAARFSELLSLSLECCNTTQSSTVHRLYIKTGVYTRKLLAYYYGRTAFVMVLLYRYSRLFTPQKYTVDRSTTQIYCLMCCSHVLLSHKSV